MAQGKLSLWFLTALVVGNMVGSGIFLLPTELAKVASPAGTLLAWVFTGIGVLFLALIFGNLAIRKPELNGGPQIYASALFPKTSRFSLLFGYLISWGYWVANFTGNVAIITTFIGYLSTFFPILTSKAVLFSILGFAVTAGGLLTFTLTTIMLWGITLLIYRGIENAGRINFVATAAKVLGFAFFIILTLFTFQSSHLIPFADPKTIDGASYGLFGQLNHAALSTLWAFVGIESAVVFASRAKRKKDVKTATILGLVIATVIYILITFLVMGTLDQSQLVQSSHPLADALEATIGKAGSWSLSILALISLFGSTIGWVWLSAEVPYNTARQGLFIKSFEKENKNGSPGWSLIVTGLVTQIFIFSTLSNSIAEAFNFITRMATLSYLVPYFITALFQLKIVRTGEGYGLDEKRARVTDGIIGVLGLLYALYVVISGTSDMVTFILGLLLIVIGIVFYPLVRKQFGR